MDTMIAYCGLTCDTCPIHLATLEQDLSVQKTMRESIAEQCSKYYGIKQQAEDISDCDGCRAGTGRLFSGCYKCELRKCAIQKNIESCAYCSDYACDKLEKHFSLDPGAQARLEQIRQAN
jgi:hypothetical protein